MELRPYQKEAIERLWDALYRDSRVLCVLPTGTGKTEIFTAILERAPEVKAIVLLNREKLVTQTARRLAHLNPTIYSAAHGIKEIGNLTVASIQSVWKQQIPNLKLIIADEAHNIGEAGMYDDFLSRHDCKLLGFTATPFRDSGYIYGPDKPFHNVTFSRAVGVMIRDGYIVPPNTKAPKQSFDTSKLRVRGGEFVIEDVEALVNNPEKIKEQIADAMERLVGRKKVVWICSSIKHCELVRKYLPEDASMMHSKMENTNWQQEIFETGSIRHMVAVMMVTEGYDFPAIDAIVMMRPTRSARLYVQVVGRGLRLAEGKKDCLVLDYGEVVKNCGPIDNPEIGKVRKRGVAVDFLIKTCPICYTICEKDGDTCPECGHEFRIERPDKTRNEHSEGQILSIRKEPIVEEVTRVAFGQHVSKKGNKCLKIEYYTGGFWPRAEFFTNHPFSWSKAMKRLNQLLLDPVPKTLTFDDFWDFIDTYEGGASLRSPTRLVVDTNGLYPEVKKLIFSGSGDRESDSDLSQLP